MGRKSDTRTQRGDAWAAISAALLGAGFGLAACGEAAAGAAGAPPDSVFSSDVIAPSNVTAANKGAAPGWSQYRTGDGVCGLRWHVPRIEFKTDRRGLRDVPQGTFEATVRTALQSWQAISCGVCVSPNGAMCAPVACAPQPLGLEFTLAGSATATEAGASCTQRSSTGTCTAVTSNGNFFLGVQDPAQWHYGIGVVGLTKLTFNHADGDIADADVLLNDVHQTFTPASLCYTLTHETGHVLGLDHSLNPDATMYMSGVKSTCALHADDRLGACHAYRTRCGAATVCQDSTASGGGSSAGCAAASTSGGGGGFLASVMALALWLALWLARGRGRFRSTGPVG